MPANSPSQVCTLKLAGALLCSCLAKRLTPSFALQAKLAEHIRQKNVAENMQLAWDHSPEVFGRVIMLYVDMEVGAR